MENPKACTLADDEVCSYAEKAAEFAVKKVFAILGVNIEDPEKVEEFREDLRFGKRMRRASDRGQVILFTTLIGVIVTGALAAIWAGLNIKLGGH